ncbi:relaxase domain-containing protein [Streptomyces canus]
MEPVPVGEDSAVPDEQALQTTVAMEGDGTSIAHARHLAVGSLTRVQAEYGQPVSQRAMELTFRHPPTAHIAWALGDYETRLVLELCQDIARDKTLAWLEESVAEIRWKGGGKHRARVKDGLIIAVFRHYESRAAESKPLLHDHAVVSIRARQPDDKGDVGGRFAFHMSLSH